MLVSTTYFSATCDACGKAARVAAPTREQQCEEMRKAGWTASDASDRTFCEICMKIFQAVAKDYRDDMEPAREADTCVSKP